MVNRTEGKIRINNSEALFSSIRGANVNIQPGIRVITTEQSQSKKHASLGGALVGGAILGPIGAVAGGIGTGKTKTTGTATSNQIPTCLHLGVTVNIDGFVSEIVLLSGQVDQSNRKFLNAQSQAQNIVSLLGALSKTPVPQSFIKPEEETSVKNIEAQIEQAQNNLQSAIADRPSYALPNTFRSPEQQAKSDAEYFAYLRNLDQQRQAEKKENKEPVRRTAKTVGSIIVKVIFWVLSVFTLLFSIVAFTTAGGILSGVLFLITALFINPLLFGLINEKLVKIPIWVCIIVLFFGFFAGALTMPDSTTSGGNTKNTTPPVTVKSVSKST